MENKKYSYRYSWKLKDVILVSMLSVFFGIIFLSLDYLVQFIRPFFVFFGLGELTSDFVFGIWFMAQIFAMYIMRKPGIALITGILSAVIQIPLGSPWGAIVAASGLMQGVGAELVFLLFRYKKFNVAVMLLAGASCAVFSLVLDWYLGFMAELQIGFIAARLLIRTISGIFFAGFISKLLADRLAKAGVLKSYPIGEKYIGSIDEP